MGIRYVGEETADLLARSVLAELSGNKKTLEGAFDYLRKMSVDELEVLEGIGIKVAKEIYDYFRDKSNLKLMEGLIKAGLKLDLSDFAMLHQKGKISGKAFLFTGTLKKFTREQAKELVKQKGGRVVNVVGRSVDYLVVGENPGSKLEKAKSLGIKIINEKQFQDLID